MIAMALYALIIGVGILALLIGSIINLWPPKDWMGD